MFQNVTLLPQAQNNGVSDHTVTCPSNPKLGAGVLGGGVIDRDRLTTTGNFQALAQKTDGPSGTSAWLFQFDNDTANALPGSARAVHLQQAEHRRG